jgi:hypothetical protein
MVGFDREGGLLVDQEEKKQSPARIEADSIFFNRIVPALLVAMGVVTALLIILALGVLLGIVPFK